MSGLSSLVVQRPVARWRMLPGICFFFLAPRIHGMVESGRGETLVQFRRLLRMKIHWVPLIWADFAGKNAAQISGT